MIEINAAEPELTVFHSTQPFYMIETFRVLTKEEKELVWHTTEMLCKAARHDGIVQQDDLPLPIHPDKLYRDDKQ